MFRLLFSALLCLVSATCFADRVTKIAVFQTEDTIVARDLPLVNKHIPVEVYGLDAIKKAEKAIDREVQKRIPVVARHGKTPLEKFQIGFYDLLNSPDWAPINAAMEEGGDAIEHVARYKVKKVPAIVFNDKSIVYGVRSLSQAMKIFNQQGGR
jgi:hypothetical protein